MIDYSLPTNQIAELREAHRHTREKREADRIKVIINLANGKTAEDIAEFLLIDPNTVRNYFHNYQENGLQGLLHFDYKGSECQLNELELAQLDTHLKENLYLTVAPVIEWVKRQFNETYTVSGMTALLHRLGFVYKKPIRVPGKADPIAQIDFLVKYEKLKQTKAKNDVICFMDAVHPQHNPMIGYGWIKRGQEQEIPTNSGRKRVNINGAIDLENLKPIVRFDETINSISTIELFKQLEAFYNEAERIYVICDNAKYYKSQLVKDYLRYSRIELVFLPPYAPNLNLIERLWKFFKRRILYNRYYEFFDDFVQACEDFFSNSQEYTLALRSLLTENFPILGW